MLGEDEFLDSVPKFLRREAQPDRPRSAAAKPAVGAPQVAPANAATADLPAVRSSAPTPEAAPVAESRTEPTRPRPPKIATPETTPPMPPKVAAPETTPPMPPKIATPETTPPMPPKIAAPDTTPPMPPKIAAPETTPPMPPKGRPELVADNGRRVEPEDVVTPKRPKAGGDSPFQVTLPRELIRQIRVRAAEEDTTHRAIILRSLKLYGFSIPDGEDIDRRKVVARRG